MRVRVSRSNSVWATCGCSKRSRLTRMKLFDPPPSTMYAARVKGAPAKPMTGTASCSAARVFRMASATNPVRSTGSGTASFSMSAGVRSGEGKCGPLSPSSSSIPMASVGMRMSEKMIAASTPRRRTGCTVTSAARSGVLQRGRKSIFSRMARYSGRYRPAWRMIHTGVTSTGCRRAARRIRSFTGQGT